jgi:hypothetical protein
MCDPVTAVTSIATTFLLRARAREEFTGEASQASQRHASPRPGPAPKTVTLGSASLRVGAPVAAPSSPEPDWVRL